MVLEEVQPLHLGDRGKSFDYSTQTNLLFSPLLVQVVVEIRDLLIGRKESSSGNFSLLGTDELKLALSQTLLLGRALSDFRMA